MDKGLTRQDGDGSASTSSLNGARNLRYPAMLPHRPLPAVINSSSLHEIERDLWGPAFDFAEFALTTLFERFEWALREKELAG